MALLCALVQKNRNICSGKRTHSTQNEDTIEGVTEECLEPTPDPHPFPKFDKWWTTADVKSSSQQSVGRGTGSRHGLQRLRADSSMRRRPRRSVSLLVHTTPRVQHPTSMHPHPEAGLAKKLLLACPFYKSDPDLYQDCRRYELQRKHSTSSCCARCSTVFGNPDSLAEHHRSVQRCKLQGGPAPSRITEKQWDMLNRQYHGRGKRVEDQWLDIWVILFPDNKPPGSVYLDTYLVEVLCRLRAFWSSKRPEIISKVSGEGTIHPIDAACVFDQVVECFLGQFEAEMGDACWSTGTQLQTKPQSLRGSREARCGDDFNSDPIIMGDPSLMMESANIAGRPLIRYYNPSLPVWPLSPNIASFHGNIPLPFLSTDPLPDFTHEPELAEYRLPPEIKEQGFWTSSPSTVPTEMTGFTHSMEMDPQPSSGISRNRHTIGGFPSGPQHWI